jgi:hypothetical protein
MLAMDYTSFKENISEKELINLYLELIKPRLIEEKMLILTPSG